MKEVSNPATVFHKTVLPCGWFFIFGVVAVIGIFGAMWGAAVVGVLFSFMGFLIFRTYIWPLPDHVYIAAGSLVVEKNSERISVPLALLTDITFDPSLQLMTATFAAPAPIMTVRFKPKLGLLGYSNSLAPKILEEIVSAAEDCKKR